ncbi:tail collar domain [Pseudomonas sp. 2848]|uniref:phage tail protein n=1 Tax=Pseudomonas sp. 2848 TaxID=2183926 RepID=UPI000DABD745|nr:phage tail protein [Pseudomonas sp. 2848]PZW86743.1 tail collar domain [Pseudomonas sp. 2848]
MANSTTQFGGFLTNVGIAQQANTAVLGLPWNITHMLIGDAGGEPSQTPDPTPKPTQTALVRQVYRAQLNALYQSPADPGVLVAELVLPPETGGWWIRELALEDANGNFIAVAKPAPSYKPLLAQGSGRTQTIRMHVVFGNLANVTLKIDPSIVLATRDYVDKAREAAELYARNQLKAHLEAADPHPQYLRRADAGKDVGPLAWLGSATGTANALALKLSNSESVLKAYAAGQRFQFRASATNTGAVTAGINGLAAVAVKKPGDSGLVDLVGGDIRADALYDLNYDGTYFQLGGGVGASKAFERFSFEASVDQTVFSCVHTVGSTIVLRNGREITDYLSDGEKVTLRSPCTMGDAVEILAFAAFRSVDGYSKAEVQALLKTASALPVGSMLPFPRGVVPAGFIEIDGSLQKNATYPDLAAYLGGAFNKSNDPEGYFRLPDTRGEFLRGWDHGRGVDSGRTIGSWAGDTLLDHHHAVISADAGTGRMPYEANVAGSASGNLGATAMAAGSSVLHATLVSSVFGPTVAKGGTETRPRSLAVMWCVKAWNAPVNQGQIDIAALVEELTALRSSTPLGAILPFPKAEVPAGYLELDGSLQSAATYPDLATYLGMTYNTGSEPAGYFRLPDYRGEFLRGWDHGRGVDAGRAIGSQQNGSLQTLDSTNITPTVTGLYNATITPESSARAAFGLDLANPVNYPSASYAGVTGTAGTLAAEGQNFGVTRPRNLAVMWCIKAWSAPVNQGMADVAALIAEAKALTKASATVGEARGVRMDIVSASGTATVQADELVVKNALGGLGWSVPNVSVSLNLGTVGAGGMNTGTAPANGYVALYVLYNPQARTSAAIAVNASKDVAAEVFAGPWPSGGFSASALVAVVPTDGAGRMLPVVVRGRLAAPLPTQPYLGAAAVNMAPVSLAGSVPPNAVSAEGLFSVRSSQAGAISIELYATSSANGIKRNTATIPANGASSIMFEGLPLVTRQLMYMTTVNQTQGTPEYSVYITGYRI